MFSGSYVALITPFKNGRVDDKKITELVEWHIAERTSGIVPVGTTGESATLSHAEHEHVIKVVVRAAKKRVPVIAGAGSNATDEAISLSRKARLLGADAVLSVNPYYNRPTQEGLYKHFSAVAKAAGLPVILYNIPSRTGVTVTVDTMVRLAEKHKNIVGVKESTGSVDHTSAIIEKLGNRFFVLSGDDSLTLPLMSVGASGVISVAANLVPRAVSELVSAAIIQDYVRAKEIHLKMFPLVKSLFIETNPGPIKAAMKEAGLIKDESLRLPMVTITDETRKQVKAAMRDFRL